MSSFGELVSHFASRSLRIGLSQVPLGFSRSVSAKTLPIVIFHAVEGKPKPYIRHLYHYHTPASFERVLDELLMHFKPLEDLSPQGISSAGADRFLVTFDDGLRSSYEQALPILERKGIPAIHFLITDFLRGGEKVEEKFKASLLIDRLDSCSESVRSEVTRILVSAGYRHSCIPDALMAIRLSDSHLYDRIAAVLGLDLVDYFRRDRPYITKDEALDMVRRGFHLGAHSCNHPRYWEISLDDQVAQTLRSVREVAEDFSLSYRYFAFPYKNRGITQGFYERTKEEVDLFFTTSGWGSRMNRNHVFHRVGLDSSDSALKALQCGWRPFPLSVVQ